MPPLVVFHKDHLPLTGLPSMKPLPKSFIHMAFINPFGCVKTCTQLEPPFVVFQTHVLELSEPVTKAVCASTLQILVKLTFDGRPLPETFIQAPLPVDPLITTPLFPHAHPFHPPDPVMQFDEEFN
jgi:hypothetical protein